MSLDGLRGRIVGLPRQSQCFLGVFHVVDSPRRHRQDLHLDAAGIHAASAPVGRPLFAIILTAHRGNRRLADADVSRGKMPRVPDSTELSEEDEKALAHSSCRLYAHNVRTPPLA